MALIELLLAVPLSAAIVGLIGGFLLAWATNNFARKREEYSYRLEAYAELLASIEEYTEANRQQGESRRFDDACAAMNLAIARIDLVAPPQIYEVAQYSEALANLDRKSSCRNEWLNFLTTQMRADVRATLRWRLTRKFRRNPPRRDGLVSYQVVEAHQVAADYKLPDCLHISKIGPQTWDP